MLVSGLSSVISVSIPSRAPRLASAGALIRPFRRSGRVVVMFVFWKDAAFFQDLALTDDATWSGYIRQRCR